LIERFKTAQAIFIVQEVPLQITCQVFIHPLCKPF